MAVVDAFLLLSFLIALAAVFVSFYTISKSKHTSKNFAPGPRGLSALLSILKAFRNGRLHKQAKVWRDQYGELVLCRTVIGDLCFLNSARLVREMYASKERELVTNDRPRTFIGWFATRYQDVIGSDPTLCPAWPRSRKLIHSAIKLYGDGVEQFEGTVQTELQRLTSRIEARAGEEEDMDNVLSYSLLCVLTVLLTGECPKPDSQAVQLIQEFDHTTNELFDPTVEGVMQVFPFLRFVPGTYYREICRKTLDVRDRLLAEFFTKAKESHTPGKRKGIVDVLLDEQLKADNQWLTDEIVKGIIQNIIAAAFLTSFGTMKAMFLFLAHNPEVTHRIQKEIDDIIGDRPPCMADRSTLTYSEAVVLETLRCSCIVPLAIPHLTREDVSIEGCTVPKGCTVFANVWVYHHDPEVFSDPDVFRPERFLDDVTGQMLPSTHPVRQGLLPFSVGKRSCPGENFARTRVFLYVTTLLQKFDVLPPLKHPLPPPDPDMYSDGVVRQPKSYHLIFQRRHETKSSKNCSV